MGKLMNRCLSFPKGSSIVFDTSSIISNKDLFRRLLEIPPNQISFFPVLTSGVYNELRGMADDPDAVRGEVAREIFPLIDEKNRKLLWYYKSELSAPTIPGLSAVDENLLLACKKLPNAVLVSNDTALCMAAHDCGIPTRSMRTNIS